MDYEILLDIAKAIKTSRQIVRHWGERVLVVSINWINIFAAFTKSCSSKRKQIEITKRILKQRRIYKVKPKTGSSSNRKYVITLLFFSPGNIQYTTWLAILLEIFPVESSVISLSSTPCQWFSGLLALFFDVHRRQTWMKTAHGEA